MATPYSNTNSDDLSNALFDNLSDSAHFSLPEIDFNDDRYNLGDITNNPLYGEVSRLTLDEITTREVCGSGAFDALMEAYSKHIALEYEKGRITGTEYARVYVELTANAMQQAIQFLLGKDQAYWSALLVQAQAKTAEIAAIQAAVELAKAKAEYSLATVEVHKARAEYSLTKMQLATEDAKYDLLKTQDEGEEYKLANILPQELRLMQEQVLMATEQRLTVTRERDKLDYEINTLLPDQHNLNLNQISFSQKQGEKMDAEIMAITFDVQEMLPAQLVKLESDIDMINANILLTESQRAKISADTDGIIYNTNFVLPSQRENLIADTSVKAYQAGYVLPSQVANTESDTLIKEYTRMQLLPAQRSLVQEQMEAKRAETMDVRTDGGNVVGSIGKQKDLYTQQIESFKRDAEYKIGRMMIDTWVTSKGIDEGTPTPSQLNETAINSVMAALKSRNDI